MSSYPPSYPPPGYPPPFTSTSSSSPPPSPIPYYPLPHTGHYPQPYNAPYSSQPQPVTQPPSIACTCNIPNSCHHHRPHFFHHHNPSCSNTCSPQSLSQPLPQPLPQSLTRPVHPGVQYCHVPRFGFGGRKEGNKKALIIGCNYLKSSKSRLGGCINDANKLKELVITKFSFPEQNICFLTDDSSDPNLIPTKENILKAMTWLVTEVKAGDSLFFSFSGHGSQVPDLDGDEDDGKDETILPSDYESVGVIVDDDIHNIMAKGCPFGVKLTCIMDCCHSGTAMDLPYIYTTGKQVIEKAVSSKKTNGDVILFSGCSDDKTAFDSRVMTKKENQGVLTFSFVETIKKHYPRVSYNILLNKIQELVNAQGFPQAVQLSSGRAVDMNSPFKI